MEEYHIRQPKGGVRRQKLDLQEHLQAEIGREKKRVRNKLKYAAALLAAVYIVAIVAFHFIEGWAWEDSIYFTTSTITTVGYGDMVPHTQLGRVFTIPLMLIGIGVGFYFIFTMQDYGRIELDAVVRQFEKIRNRKG